MRTGKKSMQDLISIIIPVFNVEKYLDECLESVVNQTYRNVEIILINDGSTDGSPDICRQWALRDLRIRYFSKENEGLGPTRNFGVSVSTGKYLMFVDSDDWVDTTIVDKLYAKLLETDADMTSCNRYHVIPGKPDAVLKNSIDCDYIDVSGHKSILNEILNSTWAKLYNKNLIVDNDLRQPAGYYEEGTNSLLILLCKRIGFVHEPLYYYRAMREGSIATTPATFSSMERQFAFMRDLFRERGLFDENRRLLMEHFDRRMLVFLSRVKAVSKSFGRASLEKAAKQYDEVCESFRRVYRETFGSESEADMFAPQPSPCMSVGSYNLKRVAQRYAGGSYSDISRYYYATGVVSMMSPFNSSLNSHPVHHDNPVRRDIVLSDFMKLPKRMNKTHTEPLQCLLLDFLDERFSIGEYDGGHFTVSDFFSEAFPPGSFQYRILPRGRAETEDLWRRRCLDFIEWLHALWDDKPIILIRMKLAEYHGLFGKERLHADIDEIRSLNRFLDSCYDFFIERFSGAIVLDVENDDSYYTATMFQHGCHPWNLNETAYIEIAKKVRRIVNGRSMNSSEM